MVHDGAARGRRESVKAPSSKDVAVANLLEATLPDGAVASARCGGSCGHTETYGVFRRVSDGGIASALVPSVGTLREDEVVFVLVWGPLRSHGDAVDKRGTSPDLDLRVTFITDTSTGERCLSSDTNPT